MIRCHALYGKDRKRCRRKQHHDGPHSVKITAQEMQEVLMDMEKARRVPETKKPQRLEREDG